MRTYLELVFIKKIFGFFNRIGLPSNKWYQDHIFRLKKNKIKKFIPNSLKQLNLEREFENWDEISENCPMYVMWWQGLDNMPPIVELCFTQLKRHAGNHSIEFICKDNINEIFLRRFGEKIPDHFLEWLSKDIISIQYFSDLVRTYLIVKGGGIWLDSTILLTKPIDSIILNKSFYSGKRHWENKIHASPSEERFTSYFFSAGKGNKIVRFINNGLNELIMTYGKIPEYLTIDYLFAIAYENSSEIKDHIDNLPSIDPFLWSLSDSDKAMKEDKFDLLMRRMPFFKMNWRSKGTDYDANGNPTIFNLLKSKLIFIK